MMEAKAYFSAKHKLNGFKMEASVLPNGICNDVSHHKEGGDWNIGIFRF